jgi:hypothetical protein
MIGNSREEKGKKWKIGINKIKRTLFMIFLANRKIKKAVSLYRWPNCGLRSRAIQD